MAGNTYGQYFRTYQDQSIRGLDLKEAIKAANGEIVGIEMEKGPHPVSNFSGEAPQIEQSAE